MATLASFTRDGALDAAAFDAVIGSPVDRCAASGGAGPMRAFGEMVAVLCDRGCYDQARQLEAMWESLMTTRTFSLFCAYPSRRFSTEQRSTSLAGIGELHDRVDWSEARPQA